MKVQYASDLHLEFYDNSVFIARNPFRVVGDVLVLAGDTLPLKEFDSYKRHRFFDWCADNFKQTFLVPGNHEYYRDDISKYPAAWRLPLRDNVAMYENGNVVVDDTEFILSTLWSHIPMNKWLTLKAGMSDFSLIKNGRKPFTATTYNELHERDLEFLKMAVSKSKARHKVVVTHHVPSRLLVAPEFVRSNLGCGFTVDLTDYIADSGIDLWVYGHSHRSIETVIGRTRMASNQVGYVVYGEHAKSFSGDRVVDLDFPTDNIPEHKEVIFLSNSYSRGNYLEQTCPDSPWYELKYHGNYLTITGEDPIVAVDPEGGPYIMAGSLLAGYRVMEIRQTAADDRILLNLKKE